MSFVTIDRNTPMLLPYDLRDWVHEDNLLHFVIEAAEMVDLSAFKVKKKPSGKAQYPPHMMLALLLYCYTQGLFSSRKIEAATYRDIFVRYLTANTHPDHDTICAFRRENFEAISKCFLRVLLLAKELKLVKVGCVAVDGTHLKANASKDKNVTYERAGQLEAKLEADIKELMEKAEQADNEGLAEEKLPEQLKRRETLKAKMRQAQEELERRAKQRAQEKRPSFEAKQKSYEQRNGHGGRPKPPDEKPKPEDQCNLTDADSRVMRKNKQGTTQSYNAQVCVDATGSQLIVSQHISQCSADSNELEPSLKNIPEELGKPERVLADCGYCNKEAFVRLKDYDLYVSVDSEECHNQRSYEFKPEAASKQAKNLVDPVLLDMRNKIRSEAGREIYSKRQSSVEPTFGIIKSAMGFRQFLLRGLEKVKGEWTLVCLAYNVRRLFNLKMA